MRDSGGIAAGRLLSSEYDDHFSDLKALMAPQEAAVESARCLFCHDAPCVEACPTDIDIPLFIRKIATGNTRGAAMTILQSNIMGGTCARVCPTEILCEEKCVRVAKEGKPVRIGELQRYATDHLFATETGHPFKRAEKTGKRVAVVGAGPAGLSCAHGLALRGHDVTVFEAREKAGGLNEYGIATYKMVNDFAQREVDFILGVGGISIEYGKALGAGLALASLRDDFDAVFLGLGLGGTSKLGIEGEDVPGVQDAVRFISDLRQAKDYGAIPIGNRVVVIGGGNTAIDVAIQAKLLGAEDVTLVYRRGTEQMGATAHEQELAQTHDVRLRTWAKPVEIFSTDKGVSGVRFERTALNGSGALEGTGAFYTLDADMVFRAIGQTFLADALGDDAGSLSSAGRIGVGDTFQTAMPGVFAGGDCVDRNQDLTVEAVQAGKMAAIAMHDYLGGKG